MKNLLLVTAGFVAGFVTFAAIFIDEVNNNGEVIYENDEYVVKAGKDKSRNCRLARVDYKKPIE